ncbi:MAG: TlyA family RNA methyltransferase [Deltaproteobacteria bacterium]|nr:TlyA family RNA methyltransferase [Deltaproteobacteria bacterium]
MAGPKKVRADLLLIERGVAGTPAEAVGLLLAGKVMASEPDRPELKIEKPGTPLHPGTHFRILGEPRLYVSRAGQKLAGALDHFGVDPAGWICADLGLSTGGFTDCLLKRGAARVHGVDVAYGVVDWKLRGDPRLVLHERTNARTLPPLAFGEPVRLVVADLSFISLTQILPAAVAQLQPQAELVLLVKPQFELPAEATDGGVVRDEQARQRAINGVREAATTLGLVVCGGVDSSLAGADGNVEHLLHLERRP